MISKLFLCLLFILTSSVVANASSLSADLGIARIEPNSWRATHAGEMQLDGMGVVAALQTVEHQLEMPAILANQLQTLVPLTPAKKKSFRILLAAIENPALRAEFELVGRNVSVDGKTRFAYVSENSSQEFQFLIVSDKEGNLSASYTRQVGAGQVEQGEFSLAPLAQIL